MFLEARDAVMGANDTVLERELLLMQPAAAAFPLHCQVSLTTLCANSRETAQLYPSSIGRRFSDDARELALVPDRSYDAKYR